MVIFIFVKFICTSFRNRQTSQKYISN